MTTIHTIPSSLVITSMTIYRPEFDETTGQYYDRCPYIPNERNRITYSCRCKALAKFTSRPEFNQHTKSKTHQDYINNYSQYYKEQDELETRVKDLLKQLELVNRRSRGITKSYIELKAKGDQMDTRKREYQQQLSDQRLLLQQEREKNDILETSQTKLTLENRELIQQLDQLSHVTNTDQLEKTLVQTQAEVDNLREENIRLRKQNEDLDCFADALREQNEDLDCFADARCV